MRNAITVYIGLTVLFAVPIVWAGLRRLLDKTAALRKRILPAALSALALVLLCVLSSVLYHFTIRNQPILVASRFAAALRGDMPIAAMVNEGIMSDTLGDPGDIRIALEDAGALQLSKPKEEGATIYYLLLDEPNAVVAELTVEPYTPYYYRIADAKLLEPQEAAVAIKENSYIPIN